MAAAFDGLSAIKIAAEFRPDLILLDLGLPLMTGYAVCGAIRQTAEGQSIMIVAQTAWSSDSDRRSVTDAGFDDHLVKPVDPKRLCEVLDQQESACHPRMLCRVPCYSTAFMKDLCRSPDQASI